MSAGCLLLAVAIAVAAQAAGAQGQRRALEVPATASWKHAETDMILPPRVAGLDRKAIDDGTTEEMDVVADYRDPAGDMVATVYLYRTTLPDVPVWFDRALAAILLNPAYGLQGAPAPAALPFARPGASTPGGLRTALDLGGTAPRSTALAVAPIGTWLLKVRLSSDTLDKAGLDQRLSAFLDGLRWPSEAKPAKAAAAVLACPNSLRTKKARIVQDDMAQVLINAISGVALAGDGPPPLYCREPGFAPELGVYRANASDNSYVVALADSGIALSVAPALSFDALTSGRGRGGRYSLTILQRDGTAVLPSFNRLPPPDQAVSVALGSRATISATTRGEPPR